MKIFYGWWVLLGLFLIYTAKNGILIYTLPLFYPELIDEFGWNAEQVTRPAALLLVVAAIIVPFAGILFDRYSTRAIMMSGILALVVGLGFYPAITSLGQLTAIYMLFALGIAACSLVPNMLILTRWFWRYRGRAAGLLLIGFTVGGAVFPLLAQYFSGASFGKILAMLTMVDSLAGSAGVNYLGHVRVVQGSYLPAFDALIIMCAVTAFLIIVLMRQRNTGGQHNG